MFDQFKDEIKKALSPEMSGEYENKAFRLKKDLAHCGGKNPAPISIMPLGTLFRKKKGEGYYSDGFHLIAEHVAEAWPEYFEPFIDGN